MDVTFGEAENMRRRIAELTAEPRWWYPAGDTMLPEDEEPWEGCVLVYVQRKGGESNAPVSS